MSRFSLGKAPETGTPLAKSCLWKKVPTRERNALVFPVVYMAVGCRDRGLALLSAVIPPMIAVGKKWEAMKIIRKKAEIIGIVQSF